MATGSSGPLKAPAGHSTNLAKLYRKAALTRYSSLLFWPIASAASRAMQAAARRGQALLPIRIQRSEPHGEPEGDTALHRRAGDEVLSRELEMRGREKVLSNDAHV